MRLSVFSSNYYRRTCPYRNYGQFTGHDKGSQAQRLDRAR